MKFFAVDKETGASEVIEAESKQKALEQFDAEYTEILSPTEYQNKKITEARKSVAEEGSDTAANLFPRRTQQIAEGNTSAKNAFQAAVSDALTIPGRGYAAMIDALSNGGLSSDEYSKSLRETKATDRARSTAGGIAQGVLRDEMLLPTVAAGFAAPKVLAALGTRIPTLANLNAPAQTVGGKFLKRDIATPLITGTVGVGIPVAASRPVLTGESDVAHDVASNAIGGVALYNAFNLAKLGITAAGKGVKTAFANAVGKKMQAANDISRFHGKTPSEIIGDIEKQYGVNLDEWNPAMQRGGIPTEQSSAYDVAQTAITGHGIPTTAKAEWLGNNSGTSKESLLKATSKKGSAELEASYRSQPEIAKDISEKLSLDNLIGEDLNIWKNYLANSETYLSPKSLKAALLKPATEHGMDPSEFKTISKHLKTLGDHPIMTPKDVELFRQRLGDDLNLNKAKTDSRMGRIEENAINEAYHLARDMNLKAAADEGQGAAVDAYMRNAEALKLRNDVLHVLKADKGDKRDIEMKMASIFKNRGNAESNSIQSQEVFNALEKLDSKLGTDYAKRVHNAYLANQLSPQGTQFNVREYNNLHTGKGWNESLLQATIDGKTGKSAFVNVAREKAKDLLEPQTVTLQRRNPIPTTYYGNPFGGGKERDEAIRNLPK